MRKKNFQRSWNEIESERKFLSILIFSLCSLCSLYVTDFLFIIALRNSETTRINLVLLGRNGELSITSIFFSPSLPTSNERQPGVVRLLCWQQIDRTRKDTKLSEQFATEKGLATTSRGLCYFSIANHFSSILFVSLAIQKVPPLIASPSYQPVSGIMAKVSEKTNDTKSTTTSNSGLSMIHIVLLCSIFVGVGAIGGYGIFYSIYNHRCSDMLDDAERRFNASQQELQNKLIESMHKSHESTGQESELLELRGRLEGHTDLMGKHQALLGTHHATVEQLTKLQAQHEQLRQQMSSVESELRDANLKVKELEKNVNVVGVQKDGLEQRLKQANAKVQELQGQAGDCGPDVECEAQLTKTMTYIQQLHSGLSKKM